MAWKDTDDFDKYMNQMRINIRKGVEKRDKEGGIFNASANDLKDICERLEILFLYPIVYRVDIEGTSVKRKLQATNWSRKGSDEWGVDLDGGEFGLLFLDHAGDSDFDAFKADALKLDASMPDGLTPYQALAILKWRSKP